MNKGCLNQTGSRPVMEAKGFHIKANNLWRYIYELF